MKKTVIFAVTLLLSVTLIAQGESKNNPGHQKKEHHDQKEEHHGDKIKIKNFIKHDDDHDEKKEHHEGNGHGNGHAYGHHKDGMTGREFGQHRAEEARSKHRPKNDKEADERIVIIKQENVGLIGLIKDKFRQAREKLETLLKGGKITKKEFLSKELTLTSLEGRSSKIEIKISL